MSFQCHALRAVSLVLKSSCFIREKRRHTNPFFTASLLVSLAVSRWPFAGDSLWYMVYGLWCMVNGSCHTNLDKRQTTHGPGLTANGPRPTTNAFMTNSNNLKSTEDPIRVAIFASGQGSNAREIIRYFHEEGHAAGKRSVQIALIVCNKPGAGVLDIAEKAGIPVLLIEKEKFFRGSHYLEEFKNREIGFIILAGFLWKIPDGLIRAFPERILNIHPALLPDYGGKGMYGKTVHEAVVAAGESQSGISIHVVDEQYDHGRIFFQARVLLEPGETAETLASKIHQLEYRHFPEQIGRWLETFFQQKQND